MSRGYRYGGEGSHLAHSDASTNRKKHANPHVLHGVAAAKTGEH